MKKTLIMVMLVLVLQTFFITITYANTASGILKEGPLSSFTYSANATKNVGGSVTATLRQFHTRGIVVTGEVILYEKKGIFWVKTSDFQISGKSKWATAKINPDSGKQTWKDLKPQTVKQYKFYVRLTTSIKERDQPAQSRYKTHWYYFNL